MPLPDWPTLISVGLQPVPAHNPKRQGEVASSLPGRPGNGRDSANLGIKKTPPGSKDGERRTGANKRVGNSLENLAHDDLALKGGRHHDKNVQL